MTKEELLEVEGVVTAILPNLMSRVVLDNGQEILATSSGRLRRNRIRLLVGDRVTVEMTPHDLSKAGSLPAQHASAATGPSPIRPAATAPLAGTAEEHQDGFAAKLPQMMTPRWWYCANAVRLEQSGTSAQPRLPLRPALDAELEPPAAKLAAAKSRRAATKRNKKA
jgi:translation initiation factor IF-1